MESGQNTGRPLMSNDTQQITPVLGQSPNMPSQQYQQMNQGNQMNMNNYPAIDPQQQQQQLQFNNNNMMTEQQQQQQQGMAQPQMPQVMPIQGNYISRFSSYQQYRQMLAVSGWEKLQYMDRCYIRCQKTQGCNDLLCCTGFGSTYEIKFEKENDDGAMEICFENPGFGASNVKGQINSLNFDQENIPHKQHMYDITHKRTCCVGKALVSSIPYIGWFGLFYACNACAPSKGELRRDEKVVAEIEYSTCVRNLFVRDGQKEKKYHLKRDQTICCFTPQLKYLVKDKNEQDMPGYELQLEHWRNGDVTIQTWTCVKFPKSASLDDKMTLIYAAAKCR